MSTLAPGIRAGSLWKKWGPVGAIGLLVVAMAFPFYWAILASLTPEAQLFEGAPLFSTDLVLDHYRALFDERNFWVPIRNSLVVAGTTTVFCVIVGSLCAYALARLNFRFKNLVLGFILAVTMFPQISVVSPLYLLLRALHLINTFPGLILPYLTFAMPLTVWLLVGFFRQLPMELEEAAMVDGASRLTAFREIILPLALPGLATTGILTFVYSWNEFLFALVLTQSDAALTLPVGIANQVTQYEIRWGAMSAAGVLAAIPLFVFALLVQKHLVRGLSYGAVKG